MKKLVYILLLLFMMGCGGTVKHSWTNFRAYYNTYYNAERSFQSGLEQVRDQPEELTVTEPIRVHPPPVGTGDQDFQQAIDKGARILRKFPDSKWVDETIELIGKSYYYRQEYYSALQKFEEQYNVTESDEFKQRAVVWKGRVLLDLEQHSQGVVFLKEQRSDFPGKWIPRYRAEAGVLLAEHHVQLEQWEQAAGLLSRSIANLPAGPMRARAHFLHGQILEIEELYGQAAYAYGQVSGNRPGFELLYWGNYKQAEVLRKMGNTDQALAIFEKMRRDDKNVERLPEIYYQIGRTEEARGQVETAERIYRQLLRNSTMQLPRRVQADIYYRLGQIYTDHFNKFQLAAAYYDSSSSLAGNSGETGMLEEERNTRILAEAYGQYSELRTRINRLDSLLWMGSLPADELDSVIRKIEQQKLRQLQEQQERDRRDNLLTNVRSEEAETGNGRTSGRYGFPNHKNSQMLAEARTQFRAVWGNRPLVDNWRRVAAIRGSGATDEAAPTEKEDALPADELTESEDRLRSRIDLDAIPFSESERQSTRAEMAAARFELGNLFMLTLNRPDSAARYFRTVVEEHPDHNLVPKALYSLYELYNAQDQPGEARRWADQLRTDFPDSRYAQELLKRSRGENESEPAGSDSLGATITREADRILSADSSTARTAHRLRSLALAHSETPAASRIHYESIRQYIQLAREKEGIGVLQPVPDSASSDTLTPPENQGPRLIYSGAYWDSVRAVVTEHAETFSDQLQAENVKKISDELRRGDPPKQQIDTSELPTCKDLGIAPEVRGGMEEFLKTVVFSGEAATMDLSGRMEYRFTLAPDGMFSSYTLKSTAIEPAVQEAIARAIEQHLVFEPLDVGDDIAALSCLVTFTEGE